MQQRSIMQQYGAFYTVVR